jgi:2-polyprenyl-3-methyl-5-hydroxy-6-metoxy-1,4-benzoquinol methylase
MSSGEGLRDRVLARIYAVTPTQKKKIDRFLAAEPRAAADLAAFLGLYSPFLESRGISAELMADAYLVMVDQMLHSRVHFLRTGEYPSKNQAAALAGIYSDGALMTQYMFGIALSLFLWKDHYAMLRFYLSALERRRPMGPCLEVGCGHGYFLLEMLKRADPSCRADAVDISATSISFAKGILTAVDSSLESRVSFHHADLAAFKPEARYEFITMGEVLEHVDDPLSMLKRLRDLSAAGGEIFVTTCANCPAIDHVYYFHSVQEIRDMIGAAGLKVKEELVAPSEDRSQEELEKHKIDIAYAALLERA